VAKTPRSTPTKPPAVSVLRSECETRASVTSPLVSRHSTLYSSGLLQIRRNTVPDTGFSTSTVALPSRVETSLPHVDVGIDLNFVTGRPLLSPTEVPGLVAANGAFRSSRDIRAGYRLVHQDGYYSTFNPEPFDHDQALAEARAQVQRFIDLMDRPPAYIHHHALVSIVTDRVLHQIADEFNLLVIDDLLRHSHVETVPNDWYSLGFSPSEQAKANPIAAFERALPAILANDLSVLITHPGYVDADLLDLSRCERSRRHSGCPAGRLWPRKGLDPPLRRGQLFVGTYWATSVEGPRAA
jgi:predicted glycoside hydrolase/deacetylase ChbG (UPF0249 family)